MYVADRVGVEECGVVGVVCACVCLCYACVWV